MPDVTHQIREPDLRRADARRNHDRVLSAALEVFTELGLDATIPQVAARAGVGKATVYRSYPTKADLVMAVAQTHVDWLRTTIQDAAAFAEDPSALEHLLHTLVDRLARDRLMVEVLTGIGELPEEPETTIAIERLFEAARERGALREDVTQDDLSVLVGGFAHVLIQRGERDPAVWRRYATLTLHGLRH